MNGVENAQILFVFALLFNAVVRVLQTRGRVSGGGSLQQLAMPTDVPASSVATASLNVPAAASSPATTSLNSAARVTAAGTESDSGSDNGSFDPDYVPMTSVFFYTIQLTICLGKNYICPLTVLNSSFISTSYWQFYA